MKVTTSDNFSAGFKTLFFSQPGYSLFHADKGTNPETAGRTAIEDLTKQNPTREMQTNLNPALLSKILVTRLIGTF